MPSKVEICILCGNEFKGKRIVGHHMSYDPEIIVYLCVNCHKFVHLFPLFNEDQLNKVKQWTFQYSEQWKDGTNKYNLSNYKKEVNHKYNENYKERARELARTDKYREKQREWRGKNKIKSAGYHKKWEERHPEFIIKRRENLKRWQMKNRDKVNESNRKWREKNPGYTRKKDEKTLNLFPNFMATA